MLCDHPTVSVHASHCDLIVSYISSVLIINFLFFRLTLPAAEYGIVSSSSSPREQNVALGIKLFNYSVSYRLANLTLSVHAPWTHQWYVCLHIQVRAACVVPGVYYCIRVCERSSWMAFSWTSSIYNQSVISSGRFACDCLYESHHLLSLSLRHLEGTWSTKLALLFFSQHVTSSVP